MKRWLALGLLIALPAQAEGLLVFAASSTTDALTELAARFKASTGQEVVCSFGASSDLARQILKGAPADVFLSADSARMDSLVVAHRVSPSEVVVLLTNQLVVIVPSQSSATVVGARSLSALRRIALADPVAVPAGVYARQWLEGQHLWESLKDRIVPTLDVRAAREAVATGNADAAIVYRTDLAGGRPVRLAYRVPVEQGPSIRYPIARLADSTQRSAADFIAFLQGDQGRRTFEALGFEMAKR